ncbi:MAG: hypothetical protein HEQ26_15315 [Dolichospermum sp. DL01]|nr:MAG: hypothetical protein HEQ26_15315 [Dolichospermum sp. DL01]
MKIIQISHSFQPLDNKTPDIIKIDDKTLDDSIPSEQEERKRFVSKISKVTQIGKKEQSSSITIYYTNREFVIETPPHEKDSLDRTPPIISYGEFPDDSQRETWIDAVVKDIVKFAESINDKLTFGNNSEVLESVKSSLTDVWNKKKETVEKLDFLFRLVVGIMIPLVLVLILLKIPQTVQQQIPQPILNWFLEIKLLQPVQKQVPPPSPTQVAIFFALNNGLMIYLSKLKISKLIR